MNYFLNRVKISVLMQYFCALIDWRRGTFTLKTWSDSSEWISNDRVSESHPAVTACCHWSSFIIKWDCFMIHRFNATDILPEVAGRNEANSRERVRADRDQYCCSQTATVEVTSFSFSPLFHHHQITTDPFTFFMHDLIVHVESSITPICFNLIHFN